MSQVIHAIGAAPALPLGIVALGLGTTIVVTLIRKMPEIMRAYAEIVRAKAGRTGD